MLRLRHAIPLIALVGAMWVVVCQPLKAQTKTDGKDAGIKFSTQATSHEVGLPIYPGAKLHKDDKGDSSAANMGLWGKSFGFKLVVLKLETKDSPDKVAAFYQKALSKYGTVLNCSPGAKASTDSQVSSKNALTCDHDDADKGGQVFKAGNKHKQHIVGIQQEGQGSVFQLVYLDMRGIDEDEQPQ
jgi:hypothetical protein